MKPSVSDILPQIQAYKQARAESLSGCLHIVVEDGNVADSDVQFCINEAVASGDKEGERLAHILMQMSKTQRKKIYHSLYK